MPPDEIGRGYSCCSPILNSFPTLGNIIGILFCLLMAYRGLPFFDSTDVEEGERWKYLLAGMFWEFLWLTPAILCLTGIAEWP